MRFTLDAYRNSRPLSMLLVPVLALALAAPGGAQDPGPGDLSDQPPDAPPAALDGARLAELIRLVDPEAQVDANSVRFTIAGRMHLAVFDEAADRMRLMTPVASVEVLDESLMYRMLQANYDSVLDSRYATAQGLVWSVFVHPLSTLDEAFLASAIRQVHTAAETFGTTFSSGELVYGGGDSQEQLDALEEALRDLLNPST